MPELSFVTHAAAQVRHELRRLLSTQRLFLALMRRRPAHAGHVINERTEIVIEGFPRSGNTFAAAALEYAQERAVAIARHLHAPAHVIEGVRRDLPVMLVLRDPVDAVISQVIRHPELTVRSGLRQYISFHSHLLPYADRLVVAPFEAITSDYGAVIDAVNDRFGTTFKVFDNSPTAIEAVFRIVDEMEQADSTRRSPDSFATVARPTPDRERAKALIRQRMAVQDLSVPVRRAREIHDVFLEKWSGGPPGKLGSGVSPLGG